MSVVVTHRYPMRGSAFTATPANVQGGDPTLATTFNFLGFTHLWARSRQGRAVVCQRTAKDRLARALKAIHQQCRLMRHWPVREQHHRLCQMLRGHFAYFGIRGNAKRLSSLRRLAERSWRYWLSRRSRASPLSWEAFRRVLHYLPLPQP